MTHIFLQKKATGQELMEKVNYQMDIIEKDYFGLQYTDHNHVSHWIDPTKPVKKQIKSECSNSKPKRRNVFEKQMNSPVGPPYTFRMRIKFYSSEPNCLREEITRLVHHTLSTFGLHINISMCEPIMQ